MLGDKPQYQGDRPRNFLKDGNTMAELQIGALMLGEGMTNGYFLYKEGSKDCIFVDPGAAGDKVVDRLKQEGLTIKYILLTHGHYDHILGLEAMKDACGAPVYAHKDEEECLKNPGINLSEHLMKSVSAAADKYLNDGDELELCGMKFRVIHTPGHTQGGCCYFFYEDDVLISGDSLFQESIGRTDFPGGSMSTLIRCIKDKLFTLPDSTKVYPGHGPSTTIEYEKMYNPFCQ